MRNIFYGEFKTINILIIPISEGGLIVCVGRRIPCTVSSTICPLSVARKKKKLACHYTNYPNWCVLLIKATQCYNILLVSSIFT